MARARSSTSQWSLPVRSVNADGTASTRAPRARERAVQLGEAQVVADREAERPKAVSATTSSAPGSDRPRLLEVLHAGQVDVEQVDLAVDAPACGRRARAAPRCCRSACRPATASGQAAEQQRELEAARQRRHAATQGPSSACGSGTGSPSERRNAKFSGSADEARAARRRLARPGARRSRGCAPRRRWSVIWTRRPRASALTRAARALAVAAARATPGGSPSGRARTPGTAPQRGPPRVADLAAVEDQQVGGARPALARDQRHELPLDLQRVVRRREAEPVGHAQHVRVDGDAFGDAVGVAEHDVGGLAARCPAASPSPSRLAGTSPPWRSTSARGAADQALGLRPEEAGGADQLLQLGRLAPAPGRRRRGSARTARA